MKSKRLNLNTKTAQAAQRGADRQGLTVGEWITDVIKDHTRRRTQA